jgi:hypothetical protein
MTRSVFVGALDCLDSFCVSGPLGKHDSLTSFGALCLYGSFRPLGSLLANDSFRIFGPRTTLDSFFSYGSLCIDDSFRFYGAFSFSDSLALNGPLNHHRLAPFMWSTLN